MRFFCACWLRRAGVQPWAYSASILAVYFAPGRLCDGQLWKLTDVITGHKKSPSGASLGDWIYSNTLTVKLKCSGVGFASETYLTVTVPPSTLVLDKANFSFAILDCVKPS